MDISTIANLATAIAVAVGLVFGILEIRHARREREERASFEVVHAIMTSHWIDSAPIVRSLDETLTPEDLRADRVLLQAAHSVAFILEALGYAVFKRIVRLETVDDLVGGSVRVAWRKLRPYAEHERKRTGSKKSWEWFQWLAEQLDERRGPLAEQSGAYQIHRNWRA
jgi:hypothetical protein